MSDFAPRLINHSKLMLLLASASLALGACATASAGGAGGLALAASEPSHDASVYSLYMAGQTALNLGHSGEAASYFSRAQALDPDNGMLAQRAFTSSLMSGDITTAANMAALSHDPSDSTKELGNLVRAVDLMARGDSKSGKMAFDLLGQGAGASRQASTDLLMPYAAALAGDWDAALALPATKSDRFVTFFANLNQAQLLERRGKIDEAAKAYQTLMASGDGNGFLAGAYGAFLERHGRVEEALGLYNAVLSGNPNDVTALEAKVRLASKRPAVALMSLQQGAAATLMASAIAAASQGQPQGSLIFLRLALRLDPKLDEAWLLVGDMMSNAKDADGARAAYAHITANSPRFGEARNHLAWSLQRQGDSEAAIRMAEETVKARPSDIDCLVTLADLLRTNERFEESILVLDRLIAKRGETAEWGYYFMRGVALERSGRWQAAEADLQKALDLNPNEPEIMNYLGYSWIDRGERLNEGLAMLRRAVEARPDSGAMLDSLGWAYYRLGDFKKAAELLERAAQMEAADPDVNNHLGDAYWRVDRKVEARFQWSRVLSLSPSAKIKAEAEAKLLNGMPELSGPPAPPVPPASLPGGGTAT